jgi:hypothetical protein
MEDRDPLKIAAHRHSEYASDAMPLVVGVTGHADLVPSEIQPVRELVREFLVALVE